MPEKAENVPNFEVLGIFDLISGDSDLISGIFDWEINNKKFDLFI